jgi:hypothetical protein
MSVPLSCPPTCCSPFTCCASFYSDDTSYLPALLWGRNRRANSRSILLISQVFKARSTPTRGPPIFVTSLLFLLHLFCYCYISPTPKLAWHASKLAPFCVHEHVLLHEHVFLHFDHCLHYYSMSISGPSQTASTNPCMPCMKQKTYF